ncbi:MAG: Stp1/IreP family PP2C-type Ser/Thr phosphatase [Gammaproteobacteria bacterium]|nr:Stp1/IreP family PP2C-type Ser/Thr phosphatase [Gammaproteobacteria bacterium]MCP4091133.1 Stp1/IreP family PP2C-type Ser/Thr phosphatase [Gammaproteobacteria bacterium]MCP4277341.1 Stp1/IreP family PP2C-type Ser/Thr phosphatase [Gammaproteobacteria bacterium]MCP4831598.1 Stp1/IreP family PP2C-type Ser/Thr phosphatase [Gammaproteobacteria bacterium]MCP4927821.1 Stp1/IreP family PP2C-type Ser/Thr phosphatase [Gammaproteobacteria bacterium]
MNLSNKISAVELTDTGRVRDHNEDAIGSLREAGLFMLADGMGGYNAGEVASSIAIKTILDLVNAGIELEDRAAIESDTGLMRQTIVLRDAIVRANKIIYQTAHSHSGCEGMGTTIVACLFYNDRISIAHVGDSRLYRLRDTHLEQITMDHSLLQELVDRGFYSHEEAECSTNRNYVTRALGVEPNVIVDIQDAPVEKGDIFMLCSDGLSDMVKDEDIRLTVSTFSANLEKAGQQLIQLSNEHGGKDNISVIIAQALEPFPAKVSLLAKIKKLFGIDT